MTNPLTLNVLQEAVKNAAAFRCRTRLVPDGGDGAKVFPPTYAGGVYAVEDRRIEGRVVRCVLLDSVQSQANRMEEALLDAFLPNWRELPADGKEPRCDLPVFAAYIANHGWVTSLTAPHRIHDAILRDSNLDGTRFRDSDIGRAVVNARAWNATAFYRFCPTVLLFGTWDSTAGEGPDSAKIPRAVVSEIIGVDVTPGVRTGSRIDPLGIKAQAATIYRLNGNENDWTLDEAHAAVSDKGQQKKFGRKGRPSDINHGNVTPDLARFGDQREIRGQHLELLSDILRDEPIEAYAVKPGGVTLPYALHTWTLSVTQLRRLQFPVNSSHDESRNETVRTVLAALALYAFALLRQRGYWLRSRCELVPQNGAVLEMMNVDGTSFPYVIPSADDARGLLRQACENATRTFQPQSHEAKPSKATVNTNALPNPGWEQRVVRLTPTNKLTELVRLSDKWTTYTATEEREATGAGD